MTSALRPSSLLDRVGSQGPVSSSLTPLQSQVDGLVGGFAEQATDWRTLAAMTAGGVTYRLGRVGALAAGTGRLVSTGIGLGVEASAFEMTNRSLTALTGESGLHPNLWRWEGPGGIRQGLLSSLITFGSLKGAGRLAQGENVVVQHLLQDTGMVLGHQVSGAFGIIDRPQGSLAEQFLHAEATNLQLSAGMALAHSVAPGVQGIERGLDLILRSQIPSRPIWQGGSRGDFALAMAAEGRGRIESSSESQEAIKPPILAMSAVIKPGSEVESPLPSSVRISSSSSEPSREVPADWPANLSRAWAGVRGSGMYSAREIRNTEELVRAITSEEGLLKILGKEVVHSIFGYGSYEYFRSGKVEDIRNWDADKKPDMIVVGDMQGMIDHLSTHWRLTDAERQELLDHGTFELTGDREGFTYFNPDMLFPGRGPVQFKISVLDTAAFFGSRQGRPILEYSQIRLKDATPQNLLWTRGASERAQSLAHLEAIRDESLDQAFGRLGNVLFTSIPLPKLGDIKAVIRSVRAGRPSQWFDRLILRPFLSPFSFYRYSVTGEELARSFFTLSYRLEAYRIWENGWGPMDKGKRLFNERREEVRDLLVGAFQRFAERNSRTMSLKYNGHTITPADITPQNMYDVFFTDLGFRQGVVARSIRYWRGIPEYKWLLGRGYRSYKQHGLPSNLFTRAYYVQPPSEYAGRKARGITEKGGIFGQFLNWLLSTEWAKRNRVTRQVVLDSKFSPVYYSQMVPFINDLYTGGRGEKGRRNFPAELRLNDREYETLMRWIAGNPQLTTLKNIDLLRTLDELRESPNPRAQSGAAKLLFWIQRRRRLEPEVAQYIQSLQLSPESLNPPKEYPSEVGQIVEHYLTLINLLAAGPRPRIYDFLRDTLRLSVPTDSERLAYLLDYIDRTERGEDTQLEQTVRAHQMNADPALSMEPIPTPSVLPLKFHPSALKSRHRRPGVETAETIAAPPSRPSDGE